ncbi:molybdenum cofactor guanylyltransferase [Kordia sp.]|uniref:molybdenum cofactor guanylyltransferase n=1 Tax=Kordia sp. TaxID=1965332 RepID=UPI003D6BD029
MEATKKQITGIILAGGKSKRMGSDKGFILYNGKPFIQHSIDALEPLVTEIIIVSNNKEYDVFKKKRVVDIIPDAGPLAGLYTGLQHATTEDNLVLSCDIPLINTTILKELINHSTEADIVQVQSQDRKMPLIALYKKKCKDQCLSLLEQGERRLRVLIEKSNTKTIRLNKTMEIYTKNVNTPIELKDIINADNN